MAYDMPPERFRALKPFPTPSRCRTPPRSGAAALPPAASRVPETAGSSNTARGQANCGTSSALAGQTARQIPPGPGQSATQPRGVRLHLDHQLAIARETEQVAAHQRKNGYPGGRAGGGRRTPDRRLERRRSAPGSAAADAPAARSSPGKHRPLRTPPSAPCPPARLTTTAIYFVSNLLGIAEPPGVGGRISVTRSLARRNAHPRRHR
jgi:hypothetical protein